MEIAPEEAPKSSGRLKVLRAKLLAPFGRFASLSRRTLGLSAAVVLGVSIVGWGAWIQYRDRTAPGPSFSRLNRLEEFLYAPLGMPLRENPEAELLALGCLSEDLFSLKESSLSEFPVFFTNAPERGAGNENVSGDLDVSSGEARFFALDGEGVFALFERREGKSLLRLLQVEARKVPVKWGLRVGEPEEYLLRALGPPTISSADLRFYRDRWGSEAFVRVEEERIVALEWRYPEGLRLR